MAEAFFKKKKKKKAFKFNANNIDAATVSSTVHVDAPALSTDQDVASSGLPAVSTLSVTDVPENGKTTPGDEWDDEALAAATIAKRGPIAATPATTELLDMKALDPKRSESDNIADKLRLEETKAQLAAAREGMEREAQRIKEEEEQKKTAAATAAASAAATTPRFGTAAAAVGEGGKWVPPQRRAGNLPKIRMGAAASAAASQKLDTKDENLFPDLATADKLLEEQQKQQQQVSAFKVPKKTPVGGRATWGSRQPLDLKKREEPKKEAPKPTPPPTPPPPPPAAAPAPAAPPRESPKPVVEAPAPPPAAAAASPAPAAAAPAKTAVKKKKKKKDLSTFKPGG